MLIETFFKEPEIFDSEMLIGLVTFTEKLRNYVDDYKDIENLKWFRNQVLKHFSSEVFENIEKEQHAMHKRLERREYLFEKHVYENRYKRI